MKKYLPLILFIIGLGVVTAAFFVFKGKKQTTKTEDTSALREIPLEERPVVSLTPSADGHWLTLKIEKIVINAESLDYELLYKLPDGRTQGVPGTISLEGQKVIERELLLGSESSGKFTYDEGVEQGTLTLRFRDEKGKLIAKFSTDFHLQTNTKKLNSVDGRFSCTFDPGSHFYVTMETFGVPDGAPVEVLAGPYGVFRFPGSEELRLGKVSLDTGTIYRWSGTEWTKLEEAKKYPCTGVFIGASE